MLQRLFLISLLFFSLNTWSDEENEPIPYFQRYKPSFFLLGTPITKVQLSFRVPLFRNLPLNFGYTQLMMWDLFVRSSPFRDLNYNPELYYRIPISREEGRALDLGVEHESNGKDGGDSRSWNSVYFRYHQAKTGIERKWSWSMKVCYPFLLEDPTGDLLEHRGIWEFQLSSSNLFKAFFDVNELVLRIYGGGKSHVNPARGGQELTYREKISSRSLLLPLYFQIFHGYGENQLNADENRWGLRAGFGF